MCRHSRIGWASWGLFSLAALACATAFGDEDTAALATVAGVVVNEDGSPAPDTTVQAIYFGGTAEAKTDPSGAFTVEIPAAGLRGFSLLARDRDGQQMGMTQFAWQTSHDDVQHLEITLKKSQALVVEVSDSDGGPIADAQVGIVTNRTLVSGETNSAGQVTLRFPADAEYTSVYAYKSGVGFDYHTLRSAREASNRLTWPDDGRLPLTLGPTQRLEVRVTDADGVPIADMPIHVGVLRKPDQRASFRMSTAPPYYRSVTDDQGSVVFTDLPAWQVGPTSLSAYSKEYIHKQITWDPEKHTDGVVATSLAKPVSLSGRALLPNGAPAEGVGIQVLGIGYTSDGFSQQTQTQADGTFELEVAPELLYIVGVVDDRWAAPPIDGFAVQHNTPVEGLLFQLQPATRLHGRVLVGAERTPSAGQSISLRQQGRNLEQLPDITLPNPEQSRRWIEPSIIRYRDTDDQGQFEFFVGPGKYKLSGPSHAEPRTVTVTDQEEIEVDLLAARPETGPISILVVDGRSGEPVAGALVHGIYRHDTFGDLKAVTDENGRFQGERRLHPTLLHARSRDGQLAGLQETTFEATKATVKIWPLGQATGSLLDEATEQPASNRKIEYGIRVHMGDEHAPWRTAFGGKTTTDDRGSFAIDDLIVGVEYDILVPTDKHSQQRVGTVTLDEPATKELGELVLKKPYQPPTLEERIAEALDGDPLEKYEVAQSTAEVYRQHLALFLLDPEQESTRTLMELRFNDGGVRRALDHYGVVLLDATGADVRELADRLNIDTSTDSLPLVSLRQADGTPIVTAGVAGISVEGQIDKARLIALLRNFSPEPLDARQLLDQALTDATHTNRRVLIQETAVWCGPCHRLTQFLEQHRSTWEKDYIWVRIDQRWHNSAAVINALRRGADGGVPWMCILDAKGQPMVTSNAADGDNIGFPSSEEGVGHFISMLYQTRQRLTDEELITLRAALQAK